MYLRLYRKLLYLYIIPVHTYICAENLNKKIPNGNFRSSLKISAQFVLNTWGQCYSPTPFHLPPFSIKSLRYVSIDGLFIVWLRPPLPPVTLPNPLILPFALVKLSKIAYFWWDKFYELALSLFYEADARFSVVNQFKIMCFNCHCYVNYQLCLYYQY